MRPRGRGAVLALGLGGVALLALGIWACRRPLLESWWLHRLERGRTAEKLEAVEGLGDLGRERAARALIEVLREGTEKLAEAPIDGADPELFETIRSEAWSAERLELRARACAALEQIAPRVGRGVRVEIVEGMVRAARATLWIGQKTHSPTLVDATALRKPLNAFWKRLDATLEEVGSVYPETYPALIGAVEWVEKWVVERVDGWVPGSWSTPADILRDVWPLSRQALADALARAEGSTVERLYPWLSPGMARDFARRHEDPCIRALSLAWAVCAGRDAAARSLIEDVFREDPHPLVRRAALRIAGTLGKVDGSLDLRALWLHEKDPELLRDIVEARSLWNLRPGGSIELWDTLDVRLGRGLVDTWDMEWKSEDRDGPGPLVPMWRWALSFVSRVPAIDPWGSEEDPSRGGWTDAELRRLDELLFEETLPGLRDALSMARARSAWDLARSRHTGAGEEPVPGFTVRELSIWRDTPSPGTSPAKGPAFLEPTRGASAALREGGPRKRATRSLRASAVFFRAAEPTVALVQSRFYRGRPVAFHPPASDFLDGDRAFTPDAVVLDVDAAVDLERPDDPELRSYYHLVPWRPLPPGAPQALSGVGLEWSGLRIGYGEDLDGHPARVGKGSAWARRRETGGSLVALRGFSERFLYLEGSVGFPFPIEARWTDVERRTLAVEVRPLEEYAPPHEVLYETWRPVPTEHLRALAIIESAAGRLRGRVLHSVPGGARFRVDLDGLDLGDAEVRRTLRSILEEEGLTARESRAFVAELVETPGVRVLAIAPRWLHDRTVPLRILPPPEELVRVGVLWKECGDDLPVGEPPPPTSCVPEPLEIATGSISVGDVSLDVGPPAPLERTESGTLVGVSPGAGGFVFSAHGRRLLVRETVDGRHHLRVIDLDAETAVTVFRAPDGRSIPGYSLSGSGSRVSAIVTGGAGWRGPEQETHPAHVLIADLERGRALEVLGLGVRVTWSSFSGDGRRLALLVDDRPVVLDLEARSLLEPHLDGDFADSFPVLSADGKRLACLRRVDHRGRADVLLLDLEDGVFWTAASGVVDPGVPSLSADGARVVYRTDTEPGWLSLVYMVDVASCRRTLVGSGEVEFYPNLPGITQDGRAVFHVLYEAIWAIDTRTGRSRKLHVPGGYCWAAVSADGRRAAFSRRATPGSPAMLDVVELDIPFEDEE